ncbi:MAG TPA: hypothetical protein VF532_00365 [Candidatus Angelobacter sp.]
MLNKKKALALLMACYICETVESVCRKTLKGKSLRLTGVQLAHVRALFRAVVNLAQRGLPVSTALSRAACLPARAAWEWEAESAGLGCTPHAGLTGPEPFPGKSPAGNPVLKHAKSEALLVLGERCVALLRFGGCKD